MVSHCGFDFHFFDDQWCWTSSPMPVDHLHFLFGKLPIQFFAHFFIMHFLMKALIYRKLYWGVVGYNVALISAVQQSDPLYRNTHIYVLTHILFHHDLLLDAEYNSYYPVYDSLYLLIPNSQSVPPLPPWPWQPWVCSLWVYFCFVDKFIVSFFSFFCYAMLPVGSSLIRGSNPYPLHWRCRILFFGGGMYRIFTMNCEGSPHCAVF